MYDGHMLSLLSPSQKQHGNLIRQPYFLNFDIDNGSTPIVFREM